MNIKTGYLPNSQNYKPARTKPIKYIVIHYTANFGDTALNNVKYFRNNKVGASAHYFVDENDIYTSVPIDSTAYHCGGKLQGNEGHTFYKKCTNDNSIGIEMCIYTKDGDLRQGTINNTIELVKYLMDKYNISISNVIRHFDVTGKNCPKPMVESESLWNEFKNKLDGGIDVEEIKNLEERISILESKIKKLEAGKMIYNYIDDNMPQWARPYVQKAVDLGIIKGFGDGLNLTDEKIWSLVVMMRLFKIVI